MLTLRDSRCAATQGNAMLDHIHDQCHTDQLVGQRQLYGLPTSVSRPKWKQARLQYSRSETAYGKYNKFEMAVPLSPFYWKLKCK